MKNEWFFKALKNTALMAFLLASTFSAVAMDKEDALQVSSVKARIKEAQSLQDFIKRTNLVDLYHGARQSGNAASDEDLIKFFLVQQGWEKNWNWFREFTPAFLTGIVTSTVLESTKRDLKKTIEEMNIVDTYCSRRTSGNNASDKDLIKSLFIEKGYTNWDQLTPAAQAFAVEIVSDTASFNVLLFKPEDFRNYFREKQRSLLAKANAGDEPSQKEILAIYRQGLWWSLEDKDSLNQGHLQKIPGMSSWKNIESLCCENDDFAFGMLQALKKEELEKFSRVFESIKKRAEQGSAGAQHNFIFAWQYSLISNLTAYQSGLVNKEGEGVTTFTAEWKRKEICELLIENVKKGYDLSQSALGLMYSVGVGVEKKMEKSCALLTQAANQNLSVAEFELGKYYRDLAGSYECIIFGMYPVRDTKITTDPSLFKQKREAYEQAMDWFARAAKKGHGEAHQTYYTMANQQIGSLLFMHNEQEGRIPQEDYKLLATQARYIKAHLQNRSHSLDPAMELLIPEDWAGLASAAAAASANVLDVLASDVETTYRVLRTKGNNAPDSELVAYIVGPTKWSTLSLPEQTDLISKVTKKAPASESQLDALASDVQTTYRLLRAKENNAPDSELVAFIVGSAKWSILSLTEQVALINKVATPQ